MDAITTSTSTTRQILPKREEGLPPSPLHNSSATTVYATGEVRGGNGANNSGNASSGAGAGGSSGRDAKRRCISSACMPCRKRKSKCDGNKPTCTACLDIYSTQCHYDLDADHRRKGALKRDIRQLSDQVTSISTVINALRTGSEADIDEIIHLIRSNPEETDASIASMIQALPLHRRQKPTSTEQKATSDVSTLENQLLMDFQSESAGDKEGMTTGSHYGHTSHLAMQLSPAISRVGLAADQVETWTTVTSDTSLIGDLLLPYFTWSHPLYLLFSEESFYHGMKSHNAAYCTPLLVNAVLSLGCHYSFRPEAAGLGDKFFHEAKRLLGEDENVPSLTTVQALGVMSLRAAVANKDSAGRRYMAQMMSMCVELGLHLEYSMASSSHLPPQPREKPGGDAEMMVEARKITFWGCYNLEMVWAVCIGRISVLPRTAIRLAKPKLLPHLEGQVWRAHGLEGKDDALRSEKYSLLGQLAALMEIVDDILRSFYAPRCSITSRKLQGYLERLRGWYEGLPPGLRIKQGKGERMLPQVITLHMFYHNIIIQTFRPFLKVIFVQPSPSSPREICTEAARTISELLALHRDQYRLKRGFFLNTHCVMSAAIIHLVNLSSTDSSVDRNLEQCEKHLADAVRGMHELLEGSIMVGRYLRITKDLIERWCKVIPESVRVAMDEVVLGDEETLAKSSSSSSEIKSSVVGSGGAGRGQDIAFHHSSTQAGANTTTHPHQRIQQQHSQYHHQRIAQNLPYHPHQQPTSQQPAQQTLFWTPYPNSFEGIPLALPPRDSGIHENDGSSLGLMDITNVLDSGVTGDWPQWNRDGFMMGVGLDLGIGMCTEPGGVNEGLGMGQGRIEGQDSW